MRMPKEKKVVKDQLVPCELFEDDRYKYRIFCTDLQRQAHMVIAEYDKRADVENLVGESKREGLEAIPSSRFKNNYAYFQIIMLAYNISVQDSQTPALMSFLKYLDPKRSKPEPLAYGMPGATA